MKLVDIWSSDNLAFPPLFFVLADVALKRQIHSQCFVHSPQHKTHITWFLYKNKCTPFSLEDSSPEGKYNCIKALHSL